MLNPFHDLGVKVNRTVKAMVLASAAGAAGVAALFFFTLGAFLWLSGVYDTTTASLAVGGAYAVVAIGAAVAIAVMRRRQARARAAEQKAAPQWWSDPMVLTTGVEVLRVLGRGKTLPLALAAVVAGFALSGALSSRQSRPASRPKPNGSGTFPNAGH